MNAKKILVLIAVLGVLIMSALSINATPTLSTGSTTNPTANCNVEKTNEKVFQATMTDYNLGAVCGTDAKIVLSECKNDACLDKTQLFIAYKVNNVMPFFKGFTQNTKYNYVCYECPNTPKSNCPIVVKEGETVKINWKGSDPDKDVGPQGKLTYEFSGKVGQDGVWQTKKGDAGIYTIKGKVFDGEFWDETSFCVEVLPVILPPQLLAPDNVTVYETETVKLNVRCVDPEPMNQATVTYSGWMDSNTKVTTYGDAGTYQVTVKCKNNKNLQVSSDVQVVVLHKNRPPTIAWTQA